MISSNINVREQLVKPVVKSGNGGAVWVPKTWLGQEVIVILPERHQFNIKQSILQKLEPYLEQVLGVFIYGSYARQEQTPESDIDVLVVTHEARFQLKAPGMEFTIMPLEKLKRAIETQPEMYYTMVQEAQPVINSSLLEDLHKIQPDKKRFAHYVAETKAHIKSSKELLAMDKEEGVLVTSGSIVYSAVLRLRGIFIINCILNNKRFSNKHFITWLREKRINKKQFQEAYAVYRAIRDSKKSKQKLLVSFAEMLLNTLEEETNKLRERLWLKEKSG